MVNRTARRGALALAAGLALGLALAGAPAWGKNVALLVGVGNYQAVEIPKLIGPVADVSALRARLTTRWGFDAADVHTLLDAQATREGILAELDALERRSAPGDTVLVYFSGHGTSASDHGNAFDLPYATGAWLPHDMKWTSPQAINASLLVGRRDLLPRLRRLDQQGRMVVVVTDSCYSGQLVRSKREGMGTPRMVTLPFASTRNLQVAARDQPPAYPYEYVIMISAASDSETALDLSGNVLKTWPTVDGQAHGAFTDSFLRALDGELLKGKEFNYVQLHRAISQHMARRGYGHEPQLLPALREDKRNVGARAFLKPVASAGALAAATPAEGRVRVRIDASASALRERIAAIGGVVLSDADADLVLAMKTGSASLASAAGDPVLEVPPSDPDLLRRISAQAWLQAMQSKATATLGLRAEIAPASRGGTFVQCEKLTFQVRAERPAHVALLNINPRGRVSVLYPLARDRVEPLAPGQPRAFPGEGERDQIVVTPPFGTDVTLVLATQDPPAFLAALGDGRDVELESETGRRLTQGLQALAGRYEASALTVRTYPAQGEVKPDCGA